MKRATVVVSILVVTLAIGGLTAFLRLRPRGRATPAPEVKTTPVPAMAAFSGKIRAQHTVPVSASVNGEVGAFLVEVGQDVYEGELLARIVNPGLETGHETAAKALENAQAKINSLESGIIAARLEASRATTDATRAKEQFEAAEKVYRRQAMLVGQGATPRLVYEKAQREFDSAKGEFQSLDALGRQAEERVASLTQELQSAKRTLDDKSQQLEETQANLAAAEVHSPATGIVVARRGEPGKLLGPEDASELFRVAVDLSLLEAVFEADPATVKRIQPGQAASITIPDLQGDPLPAAVKQVRGLEVVAELVTANANIRPGMNCSVVLPLSVLPAIPANQPLK